VSVDPKAYRLPHHALPRLYEVALEAGLDRETFAGQVAIHLEVVEARDYIEVHARDLTLTGAGLAVGAATWPGTITYDPAREVATIRFGTAVPVGAATLTIGFAARLNPLLKGLYRAQDGPEEMLCTQAEETDARAIFPCFDEPGFKARFAYRITTAAGMTVLANGPLVGVTASADGTRRTWTFAATPPMSTYLVALVIGELGSTAEETVAGTPIRVWTVAGKERMGEFAHGFTRRLLPWYEDYFGVPYHFGKYDQVAVPGFASGAMENSGLVLFRQHLLLADPRTTSWQQEKLVALVVAHEFAHQWFGNLVTMQWWDDLWLNEAFAEWIAYKVVDALNPDYAAWDDFQTDKDDVLAVDALASTHPIYSPVATPAEATELFDGITYGKGCAVLRMLEQFIGAEAFRAGLRSYMQTFAEGNATGRDLWQHLQAAADAPITEIMESWIMQPGYPILQVGLEEGADGGRLRLRQERFYSGPNGGATGAVWQVPIIVRYADDGGAHTVRLLLTEAEATVALPVRGALRWCYANADGIGFYRQALDGRLLEGLLAHQAELTPGEQMGLLSDQWALVQQGSQPIGRFLDVLAALLGAENHHVLAQVVKRLHTVEDLLADSEDAAALARFRGWVGAAFAGRLAALGFAPRAGESRNATQQRVAVLDAMVRLAQDPAAIREATAGAAREAADPAAVDPNLAALFVAAAAQFGDADRFEAHLGVYQARKAAGAAPQETNRYLDQLIQFRDPALTARIFALLDAGVLPQESQGPLLRAMFGQRHTRRAAWAYLMAGGPGLRQRLDLWWVGTLIEHAGQIPADLREEYVAFYTQHLAGVADMRFARGLEALDQAAAFQARTEGDLRAWFRGLVAG
jgi:puromycin-sensitive aminopeptidase